MKNLYAQRMCFPPLAVAIQRLSRFVTRWNAECDRRLERMFSYIKHALAQELSFPGEVCCDELDSFMLDGYPDADLAGDQFTTKSSSGYFLALTSKSCSFPLSWGVVKQGSTSQHTQEAEIVSFAYFLRGDLIPVQKLLSICLGSPVNARLHEDNNATITAIVKGYSPSLRHLSRTQRISLGFCHEVISHPEKKQPLSDSEDEHDCSSGDIGLQKIETDSQLGDFFTKTFTRREFEQKIKSIGMCGRDWMK